jgi:hypothetical protein
MAVPLFISVIMEMTQVSGKYTEVMRPQGDTESF